MRYFVLPGSDVQVSAVTLGCWGLAGDAQWGDIDEPQAIETVRAALDAGITCFDTAEMYGQGAADRILGRALSGLQHRTVVATKVAPDRMHPREVIASCEASLKRLGRDQIDLFQIHWPSREYRLEDVWESMDRLRHQGKVRALGVCNFGPEDLADLLKLAVPATNQVCYNALFRAPEYALVQACRSASVGLLAYSPLAHGLLGGHFAAPEDVPAGRARTRHFSSKRPQVRHGEAGHEAQVFSVISQLRELAEKNHCTLAEVATAWLLSRPGVSAAIVGARRPDQARRNASGASLTLPDYALDRINAITESLKEAMGPNLDPWQGEATSRCR